MGNISRLQKHSNWPTLIYIKITLPDFIQGNFRHPGQIMHASDQCNAEIQNHLEKINYHHNVTPSMRDFVSRHKGSVSRQSRPSMSRIALRHLISYRIKLFLIFNLNDSISTSSILSREETISSSISESFFFSSSIKFSLCSFKAMDA